MPPLDARSSSVPTTVATVSRRCLEIGGGYAIDHAWDVHVSVGLFCEHRRDAVSPRRSDDEFDPLGFVDVGHVDDVADVLEGSLDESTLARVVRRLRLRLRPVGFHDQPFPEACSTVPRRGEEPSVISTPRGSTDRDDRPVVWTIVRQIPAKESREFSNLGRNTVEPEPFVPR